MNIKEAIKILEKNGFYFMNQVGSHMKYGKDEKRITLVKTKSDKEKLHPRGIKLLKELTK